MVSEKFRPFDVSETSTLRILMFQSILGICFAII